MTKILIHAHHYPVASARYMADAFKRLGCEVYHDGQPMGRAVWGLHLSPRYEWAPEPPPQDWTPDLAILMDTAYQWHHETAPTVVYTVDNHVRDVRQPGIAHYFMAHRYASLMDWHTDTTWLPCAYDPIHFTPSPVPYEARRYDVALLGVMYPARVELVDALQKAGLSVIWGTGLVYDGYKEAHHDARVSLCHNIAGDLNQRVFESGAMRTTVVINEPVHDLEHTDTNTALGLDGFVRYKTIQEAVDVCVELARTDTKLGERGADAMMRTCIPHTWDARARGILDWFEGKPVTIPNGDDVLTTIVGD